MRLKSNANIVTVTMLHLYPYLCSEIETLQIHIHNLIIAIYEEIQRHEYKHYFCLRQNNKVCFTHYDMMDLLMTHLEIDWTGRGFLPHLFDQTFIYRVCSPHNNYA